VWIVILNENLSELQTKSEVCQKSFAMSDFDITGIDKVALLRKMWENTKGSSSYFIAYHGNGVTVWTDEHTKSAIKAVRDRIDYFRGKAIKLDFGKNIVTPWLYDRDAGEGAFKRIFDSFKKV